MKKILSLFLALLTACSLVGLLSACNQNTQGNETTAATEELTTEPGSVPIPIVENGVSDYVIVFPDASVNSTELMSAITSLKTKIRSLAGVRMESVAESYAEKEAAGKKRILIGNTDYDETWEISQKLNRNTCDEFIIDEVDGTIVILSGFEYALADAVKYYVDHLLESNYNASTRTLLFQSYHNPGEVSLPSGFDPEKLAIYSIVYASDPPGLDIAAKRLQAAITNALDVTVPVYKDTAIDESPFEILIGRTNRTLSDESYGKNSYIMEYEMVVKGGQFQMTVGGAFSAVKCVDRFESRILLHPEPISNGPCYHTDLATSSQELTAGADIRVMSSNILSYKWGEKTNPETVLPVVERCEIYAGILLHYQPDVIGAQEVDDPWLAPLAYFLNTMAECDGISYTHLLSKVSVNSKTLVNFSSILYRSDRYRVDDSGCQVFAANYQTDYLQRVGTYAKLTSLTDPTQQLILVNTHWAHESEDVVQSCVDEEAGLVNGLKVKYPDVTIFCTGDFNSHKYDGRFFLEFVSDIKGEIASDLARTKGVLIVPGGCRTSAAKMSEATPRAIDNNFIDHIVCTGGYYDILRHDTVVNKNYSHVMTDHQPIYADIALKKATA